MKLEKPINILVQRRAAIGDVIMATGVVRELKKHYGADAQIDIATDFAEPFRNNPHIRNIFPVQQIPTVQDRWEIYLNLDDSYEYNPTEHYVDNYFYRAFGAEHEMNQSVELFPSNDDRDIVDQDLKEIGDKFIVVHMRNWHWPAKNISMDTWLEAFGIAFEARADFKIVCVGGSTDNYVDHPLFFDARAKYNSQQIKYLCDHASAFVGIDSGPYWCAAASNTHIIALLTHLKPERILPYRCWQRGHNTTVVQTREDCRGCNDIQQRPVRQLACSKGDYRCSSNLDANEIAQAILEQLG
jgi:ADP-heptose:LPS heptosyltransferase